MLLVRRMKIPRTATLWITSAVVLCLIAATPVLGVAAPAATDPSQPTTDCPPWGHRSQEADALAQAGGAPQTFHAEEELHDLRRTEEPGTWQWQPLEPPGDDLRLWYYPGAPRPLWGY